MTWKVYYSVPAPKFENAITRMQQSLAVSIDHDEDRYSIFSNQILGFEKFRASLDTDDLGNPIYKILGIIENFEILSMMEPFFGSPTKIRAPKPSIIDFAHIVISCKEKGRDTIIEFLRENLNLNTIQLNHYITELKNSAKRPTAEPIIREAAQLF